jgi:hypothetical protein
VWKDGEWWQYEITDVEAETESGGLIMNGASADWRRAIDWAHVELAYWAIRFGLV